MTFYSMQKPAIIKKAIIIDRILAKSHGHKKRAITKPTDELILTILSQNTNDINRDRAYESLKMKFPTWADISHARPSEIAKTIHVGGLSSIKSKRIKNILKHINDRSPDYSLSFLNDMSDAEVREYLTSFSGVGPKTAACVLIFSLGRKAMPVDTHVFRVGTRLGLIPRGYNAEKAHLWFDELNLPLDILQFHLNMIEHGRALCRPQNPKCEICTLKQYCLYYKGLRSKP
jgi:endonuclease-3